MAYVSVENFKGGMDRAGSQLTGPNGTSWLIENGILNRRGEVERRKKFVARYNLPATTFGLHAINEQLFTFGSAVEISEVKATGSIDITAGSVGTGNQVSTITVDGVDLLAGSPVAFATSNSATATAVAAAITAATTDPGYTAAAAGAVITITALAGAGATANALVVAGTVGGDVTVGNVVAMSGGVTGTASDGVTYQRLQHPDGTTAMTAVIDTESFDGAIYVIAKFGNDTYHFNEGVIVADWLNGIVRADMTDTDGVAEHLKLLVDADTEYSASRAGSIITITGPVGDDFVASTTATNVTGGTDDQTATVADTVTAVASVAEVLATGSLSVTAGADVVATGTVTLDSGASGSVDGITVNSVEVMSGAEAFDTDLDTTATNVAANITANTSAPDYTAEAIGAVVTISAAAGTGAGPNGFVVASSVTTIATTDVNLASGVNNRVTSITVDGVEALSVPVPWTGSNSVLAANIASQIDAFASTPEYAANASGADVTISAAAGSGAAPNGFTIVVTVDVGGSSTITVSTPTATGGGVDAAAGQAQQATVTIGGTFEAGDRFNIRLVKGGLTKRFGTEGNPSQVGTNALTFKSKLYSTVSSLTFFSGVGNASVFNNENAASPGANFINMSTQDEGSQTLTGAGVYQGNLAVFARNTIQIWSVNADEDLNVFLESLKNTGTRAGGSILAFGNNDVVYLADSGIRSLRARDSSNAAFVSDIGTLIDPFVLDYIQTLTAAQIEAADAVLEPRDDRYWLTVGTRVFVFSFFPGAKISAWSYFDLTDDVGGAISTFARTEDRLFARSGDVVYQYGGNTDAVYPLANEAEVQVILPFLDGGTPATKKNLSGWDVGCENDWLVELYPNPKRGADATAPLTPLKVQLGTAPGTTYMEGIADLGIEATHFALSFTCSAAGFAKLMNTALHWKAPHGEE